MVWNRLVRNWETLLQAVTHQKFQIFPVRFPRAMPQNGINNFKRKNACYMGMGCAKASCVKHGGGGG